MPPIRTRCSKRGCRNFKPCPQHGRKWKDSNLPSDWKSRKKKARGFDTKTCYLCNQFSPLGAVDHIIPRAEGGSDDLSNLAWCCRSCHQQKTTSEAKRGMKKRWGYSDPDQRPGIS